MSFSTDDEDVAIQRKVLLFLGVLVGVVTSMVLFYAIKVDGEQNASGNSASEVVAEQPARADSEEIAQANGDNQGGAVTTLAADQAQVLVENGVVKFYFATGKTDLAQGADEALKDVVAGVKDNKKALVSGFHDSTGTLAVNEEIAKNRALAVKDALVRLGVPEAQIELVKPQVLEGSGDNAQARRVEVVLQ